MWSCPTAFLVLLSCLYWVFLFIFYISCVARVVLSLTIWIPYYQEFLPHALLFQTLLCNFIATVECPVGYVVCNMCFCWKRQNWPYFVQSLHQQNWHSHPGLVLLWQESLEIYIFMGFFFFFLAVFGLNDWNSSNGWIFSTLLQKKKKKILPLPSRHPGDCYLLSDCWSLQFLGSFRISDSRWIPSSGGYWYCKPGPTVSNSSLSLVIRSFPVITVVSQYKLWAAREEYECVSTSELSWISWIFPFSRVKFICKNLILF